MAQLQKNARRLKGLSRLYNLNKTLNNARKSKNHEYAFRPFIYKVRGLHKWLQIIHKIIKVKYTDSGDYLSMNTFVAQWHSGGWAWSPNDMASHVSQLSCESTRLALSVGCFIVKSWCG